MPLKLIGQDFEDSSAADEFVIIACGSKLAGYRIQDFDVIFCAKLREGRKFVAVRPLRGHDGSLIERLPVSVGNILVAIEVKDHDAARVRIANGNVFVRYLRGTEKWSNATEQNIEQVHALKEYLIRELGCMSGAS